MRGPRTPTLELIKEYWDAVGVQTELKPLERTFYFTRINAAEHDVGVWHLDAALEGPLLASKNKSLNFGQHRQAPERSGSSGGHPGTIRRGAS